MAKNSGNGGNGSNSGYKLGGRETDNRPGAEKGWFPTREVQGGGGGRTDPAKGVAGNWNES